MWDTFWAGKSTASLIVGGHSMLFWGRIGKTMQFLASLVAVLDIIGEHRLKAFEKRLLSGYARRVEAVNGATRPYPYAALRMRIASSFYQLTPGGPEDGGTRTLKDGPAPNLGVGHLLDRDAFAAWWSERLAAKHAGVAVGTDEQATDDMLRELLPEGDRRLVDELSRTVNRIEMLYTALGGAAFITGIVVFGWVILTGLRSVNAGVPPDNVGQLLTLAGGAMVLVFVSFVLLYAVPEAPSSGPLSRGIYRAAVWLPRLPLALAARLTATVLKRAATPIRVTAIVVFVAGFAADLFAS